MAKRVLQVIGGGEIGGAERHVLNLMRLMDRGRYEPSLLCLCAGPFAALAREHGIPTWEIPMRGKLDLTRVGPAADLIRSHGFDVVHTHGVRANLVARLAARRCRVPVVTTFHSSLKYDYASPYAARLAEYVTRFTNRYTARFIAVSAAIGDDMKALGIPGDKITVVYNGLDTERLRPKRDRGTVRDSLGIAGDEVLVGTVARLHPVKGHLFLLEAASRLIKSYPNLRFLLVGDGPLRDEIEVKVKELNLGGRVILTGFYPRVEEIYPALDIFCLPSLMEGMGLVILEAMYFGVPVVASRTGGIPELIEDGKSGLLVPPRDAAELARALGKLIEDESLRSHLSAAGRERAGDFSIENMVRRVEQVYDEITY